MLDPFIIDEIKRQKKDAERAKEQRLELPLPKEEAPKEEQRRERPELDIGPKPGKALDSLANEGTEQPLVTGKRVIIINF